MSRPIQCTQSTCRIFQDRPSSPVAQPESDKAPSAPQTISRERIVQVASNQTIRRGIDRAYGHVSIDDINNCTNIANDDDIDSDVRIELPFFPTAIYERMQTVPVSVWWFEPEFSQSAYGRHHDSGCHSNACTIITLLTAAGLARSQLCHGQQQQLAAVDDGCRLPHAMVTTFAESILLGNRIYCRLSEAKQLIHENLNIPEAMEAAKEWIDNIEEWVM